MGKRVKHLEVINGEGRGGEICGEITFMNGIEFKCYAAPHHDSPLTYQGHYFERRWPFGSR